MNILDKTTNLLKGRILSDTDIIDICNHFKCLSEIELDFNNSHDWIYNLIAKEINKNGQVGNLTNYLSKFPFNNGLDYKKLGRQMNLSGRTPEQQRNDMFKIMNEADKNKEHYDPIYEFQSIDNKLQTINLSNNSVIFIKNPDNKNCMKIRWNSDDHAFEIIERDTDIIIDTKQEYKVLYFHENKEE